AAEGGGFAPAVQAEPAATGRGADRPLGVAERRRRDVSPLGVHGVFRYIARRRMADEPADKECCRHTRERWMARIRAYFTTFPVIKDVPCDECREILEIRVYSQPAA